MAYVAPTIRSVGDAVTAADYNIVVNDLIAIRAASVNVQQTLVTTSQQVTLTAASTYFEIPALSVAITPTTNTSKVMLTGFLSFASVASASVVFGFHRNGTVISAFQNSQASPGSRNLAQFGINPGSSFYGDTSAFASLPFTIIDSPATTSATTYKIYAKTNSGSSPVFYLNRTTADSDVTGTMRLSSVIIAKEIPV